MVLAAARQGHTRAQNHVGLRLIQGKGIRKDTLKGFMYLTLAAKERTRKAEQLLKKFSAEIQWKRSRKSQRNGKWLATPPVISFSFQS